MRDSMACWQKILAQGFDSAVELLEFLNLPNTLAEPLAEKTFATRVPRSFAERMQPGNPRDPLLLQVLAMGAELDVVDGYIPDPLNESIVNPIPGLIHKYRSRVLLTLTGACAINCRYCFRRHFPYSANNPGRNGWDAAMDYIRRDSLINEVILSGGDPLLAKDAVLRALFENLLTINHVKTIRVHTRIPIVLPERIDAGLLACLADTPLNKVIVLHCNHPQELNTQTTAVFRGLQDVGCHLLNQSVYLAGINDNAQTLASLSEKLFAGGVLPYYLHILDKVQGAAHFDTPLAEIRVVYQALQELLPGYLVPRLAQEEPGKRHKSLLATI
jgi:EF-P beta-lysylation protein EpmB